MALGSGIDGSPNSTGGTTGSGDARFAGDVASAARFAFGDLACFGLLGPDIWGAGKAEARGEISQARNRIMAESVQNKGRSSVVLLLNQHIIA